MKKRKVYDGRILGLSVYEGEHNGRHIRREIVEHNGAAAILALAGDDDDLILVKQDRFPHGTTIEIPAGTLEEGEEPAKCATRELEEETGYIAGMMTPLISYYPSIGYNTEVIHCFVATGLRPSKNGPSPDDDESIEVIRVGWTKVMEMIKTGEIQDSKTICAVLSYVADKK